MRVFLASLILMIPMAAHGQEADASGEGGGGGGGDLGGPRGGFIDNPLKRFPTPFPTTPWFGLGGPQVPSAGNASAASPIARFALRFEELEALLRGEPLIEPPGQQFDALTTEPQR